MSNTLLLCYRIEGEKERTNFGHFIRKYMSPVFQYFILLQQWVGLKSVYSWLVVHGWLRTVFQIEDPDPYPLSKGGQNRHARGPVQTHIRYIYSLQGSFIPTFSFFCKKVITFVTTLQGVLSQNSGLSVIFVVDPPNISNHPPIIHYFV